MEHQRAEARKAWAGSGDATTDRIWFEIRERIGVSEFLGYELENAQGVILSLVKEGEEVETAEAGSELSLIVNQTPFYGESGGQMGDSGEFLSVEGTRFVVTDTQRRAGDLLVHCGKLESGNIRVGDSLNLNVDGARRNALRANHSATHLLHAALRHHLGDHVTQKGPLVAPERLRFDISHPKRVSDAERDAIEAEVNARIRENLDLTTRLMTPNEAVKSGALAFFGEKYGDEVRVVSMGTNGDTPYSVELCGGTHVMRTGDIGLFYIVSEGAVAAGVRRIEALTGEAALHHARGQEKFLNFAADAIKSTPATLAPRIETLLEERRQLEREMRDLRQQIAVGGVISGGEVGETRDIGGIAYLARRVDGTPPKELRPMVDGLKGKLGSGVCAIVTVGDGKAALVVGVTDDLTNRVSAVDLVRAGAQALGGKGGGGRPDMAQAGGPDGFRADAALEAIEVALAKS